MRATSYHFIQMKHTQYHELTHTHRESVLCFCDDRNRADVSEHEGDEAWTVSLHLWYDMRALEDGLCLLLL